MLHKPNKKARSKMTYKLIVSFRYLTHNWAATMHILARKHVIWHKFRWSKWSGARRRNQKRKI